MFAGMKVAQKPPRPRWRCRLSVWRCPRTATRLDTRRVSPTEMHPEAHANTYYPHIQTSLQQSILLDKAEPADVAVTFVRDRQCRGAGDNDVGLGESFFLAQNHLQRFFKSFDNNYAGIFK